MLSIDRVGMRWPGPDGGTEAIREISFDVGEGDFVCLVGPSGCGKTTLLKCLSGLLTATSGRVALHDRPIDGPPERMAVVFQEYGRSLFPWMTVHGNVALPLRQQKMPKAERERAVAAALAAVDLPGVARQYPWQLSGGMQQRVAIARALAYQPEIMLMDEPFASVDAQTRADLEDLIRSVWREYGMSVVLVTHDIDEAVYLGERVVVLSDKPTVVREELAVDLPAERDQVATKALPAFAEIRSHVYNLIRRSPTTGPTNRLATPSTADTPG
ncbi:MAG TPA: ABC transporter ATP-binding protein [Mycobacteriales bacterium]|nr:ABC transporter ATP-binding protein [Mycobacteriales bacterium]